MRIVFGCLGVLITLVVLWDVFETIVLPRRISRRTRLARLFYRYTWRPWRGFAKVFHQAKRQEAFLSVFGPLSLLMLLVLWAASLMLSFALLYLALDIRSSISGHAFAESLYTSGRIFVTLGPDKELFGNASKALTVIQAGTGLGLLAIVIGYLPVIYEAFSRRELNISLLDSRAGSPPTAAELLRRHAHDGGAEALRDLLRDWEHWSADLLESHLSYPVLAYFRSQHNNQSWLSSLTVILDTSALIISGTEGTSQRQAELTFAMARHAMVDLAQVFGTPPAHARQDRLPGESLSRLRSRLASAGVKLHAGNGGISKLSELRDMYEPYVESLSNYLSIPLPPWVVEQERKDNWQTSPWEHSARNQPPAPQRQRKDAAL